MPIDLRQSTASQEVPLGYFVSSTDGDTASTGLTIANTDIKLWVSGATTLANKNSGGATHISNGIYYCVLDATDTATIGPLVIFVKVSGALAVRVECRVLDEAVYDVLYGTTAPSTYAGGAVASVTGAVGSVTARVTANTDQLAGQTVTAGAGVTFPGTVASPTNITAGTITTVTNLTNLPTVPNNWLTAAGLATDAVTAIQSGLATAADLTTVAGYLDTEIAAILEDTGTTLPAQIAGLSFSTLTAQQVWEYATRLLTAGTNIVLAKGTGVTGFTDLSAAQVNAEVDIALADYDGPTNAEMEARTVASANYATAANLATVAGYLDTEIAAIKAKTDNLPAAPAAVGDIPTASANATAWGSRVIGNARTADMFLQGLTNRIEFAADGLSWTLYGTDDTTPLATGTATRLGDSVNGLRSADPS